MTYRIYTTAFHGGGCVWLGDDLRAALKHKPGLTDCECGCLAAPVYADITADELKAEASKAGLNIESGDHRDPDSYLVGLLPDFDIGNEVICNSAGPEMHASDACRLPGGNRAYARQG